MDPDETLARLRGLVSDVDSYAAGDLDGVAFEMADLFRGLDEWLTNKGYPPRAWMAPEHPEA